MLGYRFFEPQNLRPQRPQNLYPGGYCNIAKTNILKTTRRLLNFLVLFLAGLYLIFFVLLHLPVVQERLGHFASDYLSKKLGTRVEIGSIDIGLFDNVIVSDVLIYDQKHKKMLSAGRMSVNMDFIDLIQQKGKYISISSAQLFNFDASIYKESALAKPNFQFIIDSLSSKDKKPSKPLDLTINSIIIRNGHIRYDQLDMPRQEGQLSMNHLDVSDFNSNLRIKKITNDSLNVDITKMSFKEKSGIDVQSLKMLVNANRCSTHIANLSLEMPNTSLSIPSVDIRYALNGNKLTKESIAYSVSINDSKITPYDLRALSPKIKALDNSISISGDIAGNNSEITLSKLLLQHANGLILDCDAYTTFGAPRHWAANIRDLRTSSKYVTNLLSSLGVSVNMPPVVEKLGQVSLIAQTEGDDFTTVNFQGSVKTELGNADIKASREDSKIKAIVNTPALKLGEILSNNQFGNVSGGVDAEVIFDGQQLSSLKAKADITDFDYNNYRYKSINVDGQYTAGKDVSGVVSVLSPSADLHAEGSFNFDGSHTVLNAQVKNFQPAGLKIPQLNYDGVFAGNIKADISGLTPATIQGTLDATNLKINTKKFNHTFNRLYAQKELNGNHQKLKLVTDFGYVDAEGEFDYSTLAASVTSCIAEHLPTLPGIPSYQKTDNNITLTAEISNIEIAKNFFNLPLELNEPISVLADINDRENLFDVTLELPSITYKGNDFYNGYVHMATVADSLKAYVYVDIPTTSEVFTRCSVKATAFDNHMATRVNFENNGKQNIHGSVNADAYLSEGDDGKPVADLHVLPSTVTIADSIWNILSSDIHYASGDLDIRNLSVAHNDQYVMVNGRVSDEGEDDIFVDFNDVNVPSILNFAKFRAVKFSGNASGKAKISNIFESPLLDADISVKGFRFETGRFGDLSAKASWDIKNGDIMIDARAQDEGDKHTLINGYISPKRKEIDLNIKANGTRLEFLEKYTSSFMGNFDVFGYGNVHLFGPFKGLDLEGDAVIDGSVYMKTLNTTYTVNRDSVYLSPGDFYIKNDTIRDKYNNIGIANGHLCHTHFGKITYDLGIDAENLLGYDTRSFGSDTFYGTAFISGNCSIKGKAGETIIDITGKPGPGTRIVYNVTSPDAISNTDFIHWTDRNRPQVLTFEPKERHQDVRADLKLNFEINATPDLTLELLMDPSNGDYISLNGNGNLLASYYNKGAFNIYGNYIVDHGTYRLTIQNVIRKMFEFQSGGSIGFNGDAYNAKLNLQALYPVNGVSLSDINIGKRFNNNNILVNCLMDITGTPNQPLVGFKFDMPTVSSDIKSMVTSLINSEEEMNQQVLYLLAIGRFFNPTNNYTESTMRQSQTSLAMQSILSGTISQQLSNVLGTVVDNNNWNIGANISTGDEGFNNAEYEGLISGRMLNSRLLFNGQFGYRDNPNATTSFIGDFDIRYLLLPNGNAALKVYNQTNDKYFTKNSLNTQGIGLILKKDFSSWSDLFNLTKKKYK